MIKKFLHRTYELNTSRGNLFVRNIVSNVAVKPIQYFISLGSFAKNKNGVLAVMFALAAIPIILSIGAAIDFARVYVAKAQLGEALDKAALAVAVTRNASDAQIEAIFQGYFDANFGSNKIGTVASLTRNQTDSQVTLTATATIQTLFLGISPVGDFDEITITGTSTVIIETTGLEVAMVLDNTGSMQFGNPARIDSLRLAATDLVDILFGNETNPDNLTIALVPFVATVNIGQENDELVQFPDPDNIYPPTVDDAWKGCVEARPAPNDVRDDFIEGDAERGEWAPYYWENEPTFRITNSFVRDDVCVNTWWTESTPLNVLPREVQVGPTGRSGDDDFDFDTHPNAAGFFINLDIEPKATKGPNKACPDPLIPLTNDKQTLLTAIDQMQPWEGNGTMAHLGAAWGWRVLSPEAPFQEGLPYTTENNNKAIIILSDGQNLVSQQTAFLSACSQGQGSFTAVNPRYDSHYTAYGYTSQGRLGGNTATVAINGELDSRFAQVCENIKQEEIVIYTITFDLDDEDTQELFRQCATDPDKYFNSPDGDTLRSSFQAIGAELSNLRISQ